MRDKDLYDILGVSPQAQDWEIKEAYRRLVRLHHPDANPHRREEAENMMKRVMEAYAILGDASKRARYETEQRLRRVEAQNQPVPDVDSFVSQALITRIRDSLGLSVQDMASRLGLSPTALQTLEERDAIPQTPIQLRTFTLLCDQAARSLEGRGLLEAADELRTQFNRKRTRQSIFR